MIARRLLFIAAVLLAAIRPAAAGPPYLTDDPEPAAYRHYEIYIASEYEHDGHGVAASLPLLDMNYGVAPNVQLTVGAPLEYTRDGAAEGFGVGGFELGVKYRFIQEGADFAQVALYPQVVLPASRVAGTGKPKFFFPLWMRKSFGRWTAFGGGGRWINPGPGNLDYWAGGLAVTRELSNGTSVGAEVYETTPDILGAGHRTMIGVGLTTPLGHGREALLSVGRAVRGGNGLSAYFGYGITLGPSAPEISRP